MANSYVAGVVTLLKAAFASPLQIGGISPPPLPASAFPTSTSLDLALRPYLTVQQIGNSELQSLAGLSGLNRTIMQVNCWHPSYESAFSIREAVRDVLMPFAGATAGLTIQAVNHVQDTELEDGTRMLHQLVTRYAIWWER